MSITVPIEFDGDFDKLNRELNQELNRIGSSMGTQLNKGLSKADGSIEQAGTRSANKFGTKFKGAIGGLGAAAGIGLGASVVGGFIKSSIGAFADFEKNLNLTEQALGATGKQMEALSGLAKQLGADTVFSAGEASESMLELAKSGFTARQTMQALPQVMNLAATEGLALADASVAVTNAMSQFGVKAKDSADIVNALAGASNASSASVAGLSGSLSLVGSSAASTGLSVQEAAGALAALADNGLQGSIAGTSLAAVLNRLVPTTDKASSTMKRLGLDFTNADGSFKSIAAISGDLQRAFGKLDDEAKKIAIGAIFGRDASTIAAVNALVNTGADGLREYTKAASQTDAAQKLADARMKGVAGSLERLSGSWDTLKISVGEAISPVIVKLLDGMADGLASAADGLGPLISDLGKALGPIVKELQPALEGIVEAVQQDLLPALEEMLPVLVPIAKFLLEMFGSAVVGAIKGFANVVGGVFETIAGFIQLFSSLIQGDWSGAWQALKDIASGALQALLGVIQVWWNVGILAIFKKGVTFLVKDLWVSLWNGLKTGATAGMGAIRGLIGRVLTNIKNLFFGTVKNIGVLFMDAFRGYLSLWRNLFAIIRDLVSAGVRGIVNLIGGIPGAIVRLGGKMLEAGKGLIGKLIEGIKGAFSGGIGIVRTIATALKDAINDLLNLPLTVGPLKVLGKTVLPEVTIIPRFAGGTDFAPGGIALVGEQGPELVNLPRGSKVNTARETREILGGETNVTVVQNFNGPNTSAGRLRELEWTLRFATGRLPRQTVAGVPA